MQIGSLLWAVPLMALFTSFQKENAPLQLPPLTHTGENVFGCKVDGHIVVTSENMSEIIGSFGVKFSPATAKGLVYIQANFTNPIYDMEFSFKYGDTLGTYPLVTNYPYYAFFWDFMKSSSPNETNQFRTDSAHTGFIQVSYYDGNIIAGTFALDAVNGKGTVVHITDGRFDIAKQE